ncbi:MAG: 16S rRNA (adenine(1518)-N(6)/adenine(1519)-N(6))-dimethyltransferase RsmA [Gammaproteobacteria bacterium]|nr:16S rRNA (adenine(1518)-N(6)/adenine(1519)-N(6))-dimethyltransferase RsmA [Gammaproteobacteria bacterium]
MKIFNPYTHQAKKRFGQNFLKDGRIINQIVQSIQPADGDQILEIGPGLGAITREILPLVGKMTVIELDREIIPKLKYNCDGLGELKILQQDALKTNFNDLANGGQLRIVGNLPYNISTPILFHLFDFLADIKDMHFMLQKEVVDRMVAAPGSKTYGRLSVMTQYFCNPQLLFYVPPESFEPAPKVESAIVRLTPVESSDKVKDFKLFSEMVTQAFNMRRKTIRNVWKKYFTDDDFAALSFDPTLRPENLSLDDFLNAANYYHQHQAAS